MRLLLLGKNLELTLFRAEVLRSAGYEVDFPIGHRDMKDAISDRPFDIVIVSHTMEKDSGRYIRMARTSCPACPVIYIAVGGNEHFDPPPHFTIQGLDGPQGLLRAVKAAAELRAKLVTV